MEYNLSFVNNLEPYQLLSILMQSQFSRLPAAYWVPENSIKLTENHYLRFDEVPKTYKHSCKFGIPDIKRTSFYKDKVVDRSIKPREEIFPQFFKEGKKGYLTDETILHTYKTQLDRRPIIMQMMPDLSGSIFLGLIKGCYEYNLKYEKLIKLWGERIMMFKGKHYFLTITYDIKTFGEDITQAWKVFREHCTKLLRQLRDKFGIKYIGVTESTNKGYPHAHLILHTEEDYAKTRKKAKGGAVIYHGALYNYLKENVQSPVFRLQHADPDKLQNYLLKYVSKGARDIDRLQHSRAGKLSRKQRKNLLSCICPVCTRTRQFFCSRSISSEACFLHALKVQTAKNTPWTNDRETAGQTKTEKLLQLSKDLEKTYAETGEITEDYEQYLKDLPPLDRVAVLARLSRALLIGFLTNTTKPCNARCFVRRPNRKYGEKDPPLGKYKELPAELRNYYRYFAKPMGCPGCLMSNWRDRMGEKLKTLNLRFYEKPYWSADENQEAEDCLYLTDYNGEQQATAEDQGIEWVPHSDRLYHELVKARGF